ncbi:MAG: hypothetical protein SX243_07850 [Acidobacteriota bacterium]|nr:hypothetical protein [Acidobacteriota bacterium]
MSLYRLLRRPTPVSPFVVGIDACNLELETPPEVFAPVFRFLREYPISMTGMRQRYSPYYDLRESIHQLANRRQLGMTYHVGEDFRHLLSGLRAIHEVVEFLSPRPGDRLGHGTALALDPEAWLKHNGYQAILPSLEWLDTLVWVHHFLGPGDNLVGELELEDRIQRLSWEIYSPALAGKYDPLDLDRRRTEKKQEEPPRRGLLDWDWSPLALWDAWMLRQLDPYSIDINQLLHGELKMRPLGTFCEESRRWHEIQDKVRRHVSRQVGSRNAFLLLASYWIDPQVRKRGRVPLVVDMKAQKNKWLALCQRVEEKMKGLIHESELVVEANPSSNRIIGPMASYGQHHIFNLTLDKEKRLSRGVRVSVNTDNPAVCNTTLAHEHYLLGEILIQDGVPEAEVVQWLEWLRKNGEEYNFVRRLPSAEKSPHMQRLMDWLRKIRPGVLEARDRHSKHEAFRRWHLQTRLRSHGFPIANIEQEPELLERLLGLEAELKRLRHLNAQGGAERDRAQQLLAKLEAEVERLRQSCTP